MGAAKSSAGKPFDLDQLRELIALMDEHALTEIGIRQGDQEMRLCRGPGKVLPVVPPVPEAPAEPEASEPDAAPTINSPTVGTFYAAASPDDDPFVKVGSTVEPDTIVCIVEAMKVFNQIPAEISGTIAEFLVANGDTVEFGQPLFRIRPS